MAEHGLEIEGNAGSPPALPEGTSVAPDGSIVSPEMNAQKPPAAKILGKFDNHEALEKAYVELEKKLGSRAPVIPPKEETSTETPPKVEEKKTEEPPAKTPEELDDEQRAAAASVRAEMAEVVGGDEHLTKVLEWAQKNLSKEEAEFYNKAVAADDKAAVKMALRGIAASYERAFPSEPVTPAVAAASRTSKPTVKPFATKSEMYAAIGDARYAEDATYRRGVEARIMASPW